MFDGEGHCAGGYGGAGEVGRNGEDDAADGADQLSIGLILCMKMNRLIAKCALRDARKPIGVSAYRLTEQPPDRLKGSLPTVEQLEAKLADG